MIFAVRPVLLYGSVIWSMTQQLVYANSELLRWMQRMYFEDRMSCETAMAQSGFCLLNLSLMKHSVRYFGLIVGNDNLHCLSYADG